MKTIADILYANTPQRPLRLDLRLPDNADNPPLVLFIPMGGMTSCPKENPPAWIVDHGFALASIECRVTSEAIAPAEIHDCKSAVRWLRAHAGEYGYNGNAIGVWGHSAGGNLAALLATSGDRPELEGDGPCPGVSSRVQAACDQCGAPHDFSCFARPDIKARFPGVTENVCRYFGGLAEEQPDLARLVSATTYITPQCAPILLIHGDQDNVVPIEDTIDFHQRLVAAGVDSTLRVLPGIGHGWDAALTRDDVLAFFTRTLKKGATRHERDATPKGSKPLAGG